MVKRVPDAEKCLSDPRNSQKRVSDGKMHLPDPPRPQMPLFITSFSAASTLDQFFITSFSCCILPESVFVDLTVHNPYHTPCMFCHIQIMGNHHNGISHLIQIFKELQYLFSTVHIERACRLICKQNGRFSDQCTRNGYTLLLSAGKFIGLMSDTL